MPIRPAEHKDIDQVLDIFDTARRFMRAHGNLNQWIGGYPSRQLLENDVSRQQLYVLEDDGVLHGAFAFILGDDPTYALIEDGQWPSNAPYGTIHRIASDGSRKGILRQAVDFALTHCDHLRADTHHDNYVMQNALMRLGFQYCGIIYVEDGSPRKAYQLDKPNHFSSKEVNSHENA